MPLYFEMSSVCTTFAATKLIKMIETLLITVLIIAICITLLCVKVIFKKNGKFSSQHIHDSKAIKTEAFIALWTKTVRLANVEEHINELDHKEVKPIVD